MPAGRTRICPFRLSASLFYATARDPSGFFSFCSEHSFGQVSKARCGFGFVDFPKEDSLAASHFRLVNKNAAPQDGGDDDDHDEWIVSVLGDL